MPLQLIDLGKITLTNPADGLQLEMINTAGFHIPDAIWSLDNKAFVDALTAGRLWATRATGCSLDVQVRFNGHNLAGEWRLRLLESLGYGFRDLEIWGRLSIATFLSLSQPMNESPENHDRDHDFSIYLQTSSAGPDAKSSHDCLLELPDVVPPESVLCAKFDGLQIQLNFSIPARPPKRPRNKLYDNEVMLLDSFDTPYGVPTTDPSDLERVIGDMQSLPSSIASCFDLSIDGATRPLNMPQSSEIHSKSEPALPHQEIRINGKAKHPQWIRDIIQEWMDQHGRGTPLQGSQRKSILAKTGLTSSQLASLTTRMRRVSAPVNNEEMLIKEPGFAGTEQEVVDEDMLLSFEAQSAPSLISNSSTIKSSLASITSKRYLTNNDELSPGADFSLAYSSSATALSVVAMRVLIGGCVGPNQQELNGIYIQKSATEAVLASLVPTVFNQGYLRSISHNARFLPRISNAISQSLPQNTQSPTLRHKLLELSNKPPSSLTSALSFSTLSSSIRLPAVVQSRLWTVMQTALYDPISTKRMWNTKETKDTEDDDDLIMARSDSVDFTDDMSLLLADDEDFYDLFDGSDDGNILEGITEAEREQLEVERETDDMLLGNDWNEWDPDEEVLLIGDSVIESMLV